MNVQSFVLLFRVNGWSLVFLGVYGLGEGGEREKLWEIWSSARRDLLLGTFAEEFHI